MEIEEYLTDRITYLKTTEMEYFSKAYDISEQKILRSTYREFSNECMYRRQELETLLLILKSEKSNV